ncbi:MAG: hypothetical protein IKG82_13565 [Oscillospiraceae bacterium]|nr:hypothetical protein [Oscillospiraceae bacterium]MBR3419710.1 hypothetical protein [Oscillospiraceae bacterium]
MNTKERCAVVRAMELIARTVTNDSVFTEWQIEGVDDGDITPTTTDADLNCYVQNDDQFGGLLYTFLHLMHNAYVKDGLTVDGVKSEYYDLYNDMKGGIQYNRTLYSFSEHSLTISGEEEDLLEFARRIDGSEFSNTFTDLAFKILMELDDAFREQMEDRQHEQES